MPHPIKYFAFITLIFSVLFLDNASAAVITFSPGFAYQNNGSTQTLLLLTSPQSLSNRYVANNNWHNSFVAQLSAAKDFLKHNDVTLRLGLTLGYVNHISLNGIVDQFALADFDNLNYQYQVQSFSAMATLKILFSAGKNWQPYVDGSVGFSNNRTSDYQETPRIYGAVPMQPFANHTTTSFADSIGAGLMYHFNQQFAMGIGYEYTDLGKTQLGTSSAQQTTQTLTFYHMYLSEYLLNLSWNV